MGLGATDPKGVFETTAGLEEMFGPKRIFDAPSFRKRLDRHSGWAPP